MSCKKNVLGSIVGLQALISYLEGCPDSDVDMQNEDDKDWQGGDAASWGWGEEVDPAAGAADEATPADAADPDWLDCVCVAVSPLGDVMALAVQERVAVLHAQWDSDGAQWRFAVAAKMETECVVTSLLCLPLASAQRSSSGAADWTCLVVGHQSGHVAFYTEDGSLLFRQQLHESAVHSVCCCSRQVSPAAEEELTVVFRDAVVMLDGFSLYQTLRACRSQLARVWAGGGGELDPPPLAQQKWALCNQQRLEAAENVGFLSTSLFDHLLSESMRRPGGSVGSAAVPAGSLLVTTGRCPFVGFFHAAEGVEQARLDQVFRGVASKVKDTVFSTIGSLWSAGAQQSPASKAQPQVEPGKPVRCRFGLPDVQRHGQLMALSRDRRLSAVTDSFGRVTLIDNHAGVVLAMRKGYRDAECGWLEVREPRAADGRRSGRRTAFLVMYAPRRGLLEVWSAVGPKVAAFNVTKHGRLLNISHGLLGVSESESGRRAAKLLQCVLLSPDGRITTMEVPFHLALSEQGSRRAHGQHLLRELRAQLRAPPPHVRDYLRSQLAQMRTASARRQALELVLACRRLKPEDMEAAVDAVFDEYSSQEPASLDYESQQLMQTTLIYKRLLAAFRTLEALALAPPPQEADFEITAQSLAELLRASPTEAAALLARLDSPSCASTAADEPRPHVTFADEPRPGPAAFLKCFHVRATRAAVDLREGLTEEELRQLAVLMFAPCLDRPEPPSDWRQAVLRCGLPAAPLLRLLALCWLSAAGAVRPPHLVGLATLLASVAAISGEPGREQWSVVQDLIGETTSVWRGLLLATVCRAVAVTLERRRLAPQLDKVELAVEAGEDLSPAAGRPGADDGWEELTEQTVSWDLLLYQLRDVVTLCHVMPADALPDVTLRSLLKKGPGAVSELVARWLLSLGVEPDDLAADEPAELAGDQQAPPEDAEEEAAMARAAASTTRLVPAEAAVEATVLDTERARRRHRFHEPLSRLAASFPHSVRPDTLLLNCCWEDAAAWGRQHELVCRLAAAVRFAGRVRDARLRYGACSLLWSALLCRPCASVARLLQSGQCPDDAASRRELHTSALQLPALLDAAVQLLELMVRAMVVGESEPSAVLFSDNLWATEPNGGPTWLLQLAARQPRCTEDLAALHLQALQLMRAQLHLKIKKVNPYACFNEEDGRCLFGELTARYTEPPAVDQAVRLRRESALCRWVSAAVRLVCQRADGQLDVSETVRWVARCEEAAAGWEVPVDVVRRQYTLDLYNGGHDQLASEVLTGVSRAVGLPSQLLLLAGARVRHYIYSSGDMIELLARLTISMSDFLKTADVPLQCPAVCLKRTLSLLRHIARLSPDTAAERHITLELIRLVEGMVRADQTGPTQN